MEIRKWIHVSLLTFVPTLVFSTKREDHVKLHKYLLANYTADILPITYLNESFNIEIQLALRSIREFNVVDGVLSFTDVLYFVWTDEYLRWNPDDFGNITHTGIPMNKVWTPKVVLLNSVSIDYLEIDRSDAVTIISYDGQVQFGLGGYFQTICLSDITYYPFDRHTCAIEFSPLNTWMTNLNYSLLDGGFSDSVLKPSGTWTLTKTEVNIKQLEDFPVFEVSITLERIPNFLILNIFAPVFILTAMNLFVFVMPAESGERISYSTTLLLALVVFLTIVADKMPQTSNPTPYISYKLLVDVIVSALITLSSMIGLRIYYKDNEDPIPRIAVTLARLCVVRKRKRRSSDRESSAAEYGTRNITGPPDFPAVSDEVDENDNKEVITYPDITWKHVSVMLDRILFSVFFAIILSGEIIHLTISFSHCWVFK